MRFIHIADLHASRERKEQCLTVLTKIKDYITSQSTPPKLLISGDFWDSVITNTEAFASFLNSLKQIISITDVYMIYGTASHEPDYSLQAFQELGAHIFRTKQFVDCGDFELVAIPEPRRTDYQTSKNIELAINKDVADFISNLPPKQKTRIVIYHGEIAGAQFDNGEVIASKIAVQPAVLKKINADYYACGHIHLPQEVFKNCYYSGSCYPVTYGEHHIAGFNDIIIEENTTKVTRIDFGFPQNITEFVTFDQIDTLKQKDFSNKRVHIKLTLDKLLKKTFNTETLRKELKEKTNAVDVKISFNYTTTSNIRSEKISGTKSSVEKFKLYADVNDVKYREEVLAKIQDIEDNLLIEKFIPNDSFELMSISLRGAIGIKDGIGRDELNIDFTQYSDGILGLIGSNGAGKTTILENCHPYPQMLTRGGSLKDHFFLKDSHRILIYRTSSGKEIKISMIIDGAAKCIGTRYIVTERKNKNEAWTPVTNVDGSYDSYKEWVSHTFGSLDMFLRTSFYAKEQIKSVPDLSKATKAEKMTFFSTLAGTEYLSKIADEAKRLNKEEEEKIKEIKSSVKDFDNVKQELNEAETTIERDKIEVEKLKALLEVDNKELEVYKEEQNKYLAVAGSLSMLHDSLKSKTELEETLSRQYLSLQDDADELQDLIANKEDFKAQLEWLNENTTKKSELKKEIAKLQDDVFQKKCRQSEVETKVMNLQRDKLDIERTINKLELKIETINNGMPDLNGNCPVCGAPLSEHKKEELKAEVEDYKNQLKDNTKQKHQALTRFAELENEIKLYDIESYKKEILDIENSIFEKRRDIDAIDGYIETLDIDRIKYVCEQAEADLQKTLIEKKETSVKLEKAQKELKELEDMSKNQPKDYSDKIKRLERGILDTTSKIGELTAESNLCLKQLEKLRIVAEQVKDIEGKLTEHRANQHDYSIIEKAFGNNGIQSLELDTAAPEISDITNAILHETYGDRFTLSFETQRDTADGRRIDDFIINVFDAKSGRLKKLDVLCSGESVWIKQALYYAFSVLRTRRTGFCFKTRFLDEADGSLDSEARLRYVKMIKAAHKACNARLTLLITHSQEIKDILEQKIELTSGSSLFL